MRPGFRGGHGFEGRKEDSPGFLGPDRRSRSGVTVMSAVIKNQVAEGTSGMSDHKTESNAVDGAGKRPVALLRVFGLGVLVSYPILIFLVRIDVGHWGNWSASWPRSALMVLPLAAATGITAVIQRLRGWY